MLSRLVITFLPRSKHLLISWLQSPSAEILEPRKIKSATISTVSPSICHEVMGPDAMMLVFWMLSVKLTFLLSTFAFIKRLFSSSLSAIRVVSSADLRLLIFFLAILIPACASSSPAFSHMGHCKVLGRLTCAVSRSLLILCFIYGGVYMSIPIFQFILPHYLLVTISLFFMSLILFPFCRYVCL